MGLEKSKIKLNSFTGKFDYITLDNHSYTFIPFGKNAKVRLNQEMLIDNLILIDGLLICDGLLNIISSDKNEQNFSFELIENGKFLKIDQNQQMIVDEFIDIQGILEITGSLSVITSSLNDVLPLEIVLSDEKVDIPSRRQLHLSGPYIVDGLVNIEGTLSLD